MEESACKQIRYFVSITPGLHTQRALNPSAVGSSCIYAVTDVRPGHRASVLVAHGMLGYPPYKGP